ncbi:MAG: peptidoglycan DD-metalloendopeptidase family protein, partial [Vibrio casei]
GDMTLYGYNQSLLKKDGDIVRAGETIALAGNTGGQSRTSLYFEIRRNSQAQNPKSWLK